MLNLRQLMPVAHGLGFASSYWLMAITLNFIIVGILGYISFTDKRKTWVAIGITTVANFISNYFFQAEYSSSPSEFLPGDIAQNVLNRRTFFETQTGTVIYLLLSIAIVETIIVITEGFIYAKSKCCKHPHLFSLETNLISLGTITLIQLLSIEQDLNFSGFERNLTLKLSEIATSHDWETLFDLIPKLYRAFMIIFSTMTICGLCIVVYTQIAKRKENTTEHVCSPSPNA